MEESPVVARVLGTEDATPLEFWVGVQPDQYLQLDDVVVLDRVAARRRDRCASPASSPRSGPATRAPASTPTCSSSPTACCPAEISRGRRRCMTTRVEPEIFVPPLPGARGAPGRRATSATQALFFDQMDAQAARSGSAATASRCTLNLEFLDGTRGAHVNISRHLRRGDQDDLRHLPALRPVPLGRARRRGASTPRR